MAKPGKMKSRIVALLAGMVGAVIAGLLGASALWVVIGGATAGIIVSEAVGIWDSRRAARSEPTASSPDSPS